MYMQRILFILTVAVLSLFASEAYAQRDLRDRQAYSSHRAG